MVAGHTKFSPDRLFSEVATTYACSDVFTTEELAAVASNYSSVMIDKGEIVRAWRAKVEAKYTKLPGI